MPVKLDSYTSFDDAFKQSPELVWTVAKALFTGRSFEERHTLLNGMALAAAKAHQDEQLLVLLQMIRKLTEESVKTVFAMTRTEFKYASERDRAAESEAGTQYRAYIAELFWLLPDTRREKTYAMEQDGSRYEDGQVTLQALPATKRSIFRELLSEWTYEPTEKSVHAFRRVIAMGWPMSLHYTYKREGESDLELKARGRFVGQKEQEQYATAVRERLGGFDSYDAKKHGADAVFGPWLAQNLVPEEIVKLLVIARAKMGGIEMARRDVHYASVLGGLPESGIVLLRGAADLMRCWLTDAEAVLNAVVEAQRKRNPYWRGSSLPHAFTWTSQKELAIEFGSRDDDDQAGVFGDANVAIASAKKAGWFQGCTVKLVVSQSDKNGAILRNTWYC